ncbi:MAG: DUF3043 domain-containing protein [Micrococcales bacterium]
MTDQATNEEKKGKGHATPSRKDREAARKKLIVGDKTKEAKKAARAKSREESMKIRAAMSAGDDRYLTARDKGPQRRLVRDLVDARFSVGELMIPLMVVVLIFSNINNSLIQVILVLTMWALMIAIVLDGFLIGRQANKIVAARFGADKVEKGLRWYAAVRSTQLRAMRLPKPQVKRGTKVS